MTPDEQWQRLSPVQELPELYRWLGGEIVEVADLPRAMADDRRYLPHEVPPVQVRQRLLAGILGGLGRDLPPALGDWRARLREGADIAADYFDRHWEPSRRWFEPFRRGLLCALASANEPALGRLLAWPRPGLAPDDRTYADRALKPGDSLAYAALCAQVRGDDASAGAGPAAEQLRGRGSKWAKLLAAAGAAIAARDGPAVAAQVRGLLQDFRRAEFSRHQVATVVAINASVVHGLARRAGLATEIDDPDLAAMLFAPQAAG